MKIEDWRLDYNEARPHESLGYLAPSEFARTGQVKRRPNGSDNSHHEWIHFGGRLKLSSTNSELGMIRGGRSDRYASKAS